jgi:hypothetical protein
MRLGLGRGALGEQRAQRGHAKAKLLVVGARDV